MTVTSNNLNPDDLPVDCSVGPSANTFDATFAEPIPTPPGAPAGAQPTVVGVVTDANVVNSDHGEYVLVDDPRWPSETQVPSQAEVYGGPPVGPDNA